MCVLARTADLPQLARHELGQREVTARLRHNREKAHLEDALRILWVWHDSSEVERPPHHPLATVALLPARAPVFRHEQRRADVFNQGVDLLRVGRSECDLQASPRLL